MKGITIPRKDQSAQGKADDARRRKIISLKKKGNREGPGGKHPYLGKADVESSTE